LLEECRRRHLIPTASVFLMITGERGYERVFAAAELAPDDYLLKPMTPVALGERLGAALNRRTALKSMTDLLDAGRYLECIALAQQALAGRFPYRLDAQRLIGESLMALGRHEDARAHYDRIVQKHPGLPWARFGAARACYFLDAYDESRAILEDLVAGQADFTQAQDLMAQIHEAKGDQASSRALLKSLLKKNPRAITRHREVVRLALELNDVEDARLTYDQMFKEGLGLSSMNAADFCGYSTLLMKDPDPQAKVRLTQMITALNDHYLGGEATNPFRIAELTAQFGRARIEGSEGQAQQFYEQLIKEMKQQDAEGDVGNSVRLAVMEAAAAYGDRTEVMALAEKMLEDYAGNDAMSGRIVGLLESSGMGDEARALRETTERQVLKMNKHAVELAKKGAMKEAMAEFIRLADQSRNLSVTFNAGLAIVRWLDRSGDDAAIVRKLSHYLDFINNRDPENPKFHSLRELAEPHLKRLKVPDPVGESAMKDDDDLLSGLSL
jgi:tetratricopeptide (TPR) repeat protein